MYIHLLLFIFLRDVLCVLQDVDLGVKMDESKTSNERVAVLSQFTWVRAWMVEWAAESGRAWYHTCVTHQPNWLDPSCMNQPVPLSSVCYCPLDVTQSQSTHTYTHDKSLQTWTRVTGLILEGSEVSCSVYCGDMSFSHPSLYPSFRENVILSWEGGKKRLSCFWQVKEKI